MVTTKQMQNSDNIMLPAVVGGLIAVLVEQREDWKNFNKWLHSLSSGFISFCTAYYLVPALLAYLHYRYQSELILDTRIVSLTGFVGGLLGAKIINLILYMVEKYSKKAADRAANKFLSMDAGDEPQRGDKK